MKECTFHLLTDKPIYEFHIRNHVYKQSPNIDTHEHWAKTYFFDPNFIQAKKDDETVIMDIDMFWMNNPSDVLSPSRKWSVCIYIKMVQFWIK